MRERARLWLAFHLALAIAAAFPGCLSPAGQLAPPTSRGISTPPVVVALIDTGINPYHEVFAAGSKDAAAYATESGIDAEVFALASSGDYPQRRAGDDERWMETRAGRLYAFAGTRVLGISVLDDHPPHIISDASLGHGTPTASMVAREAPDAIIVMVHVDVGFCRATERCFINESVARGLDWAASQPWIDVISVSIGTLANHPDDPRLHEESAAYVAASKRAVASGKILVNGAGNHVAPPFLDYFNGPPWVIAVGGAQGAARGESAVAGKGADVVANFTERVARAGSLDGYDTTSGTSLSGPIVAGTLANAIGLARAAAGHEGGITEEGLLVSGSLPDGGAVRLGASDFRAALNASAVYFSATAWRPQTSLGSFNDTVDTLFGASVPVAAAPVQMGWGHVDGGLAPEIARRALDGDLAPPPEKAATAAWMGALIRLREAYWGQVWPG